MMSKVDGQAFQTVIRRFLLWQPLRWETGLSLSANAVFPQFLYSAYQVIMLL